MTTRQQNRPRRWLRLATAAAVVGGLGAAAGGAMASPAAEYGMIAGGAATGIAGIARMKEAAAAKQEHVAGPAGAAAAGVTGATGNFPGMAPAQPSVRTVVSSTVRVAETQLISGDQRISVDVRKGGLLRLKEPVGTVFIANPDIADVQVKSPTLIYIFGKAPGETTLYALSSDDRVIFSGIVTVQHNLARLRQAVAAYLPDTNVELRSIDDSIVISGRVHSAAQAEDLNRLAISVVGSKAKVINRVQIAAPNQVNLRVRIAEMSREIVKELGFNWDASLIGNKFRIGLQTGGGALIKADNALSGFVVSGKFSLDSVVNALEREGLISVLAEPNLTALSGETASFLAGGEFPIPVPQDNRTISITFKQFGVGLAFTPTLLSDERINLKVRPEVSQLTSAGAVNIQGFSIPALTTRRAETTVELGSGQSFAIAGLLQNTLTRDLNKFPGLADLPILGALFRSDDYQRNESELVIIVTPYIVRPVSAPRLALPTDGLKMPRDMERLFKGTSYSASPYTPPNVVRDRQGRRLIGPAGFSLN